MRNAAVCTLVVLCALARPAGSCEPEGTTLRRTLHFRGPIQPAWRQALDHMGVEVRGYVAPNGLAVWLPSAQQGAVAKLAFVASIDDDGARAVGRLALSAPAASFSDVSARVGVAGRYAVSVAHADDLRAVARAAEAAGAHLWPAPAGLGASPTIFEATLSAAAAQQLCADPRVESCELSEPMRLHNDLAYGIVQAGQIYHDSVWSHGLHGEGQLLGACDVGVTTDSCFFPPGKIVAQQVLFAGRHDRTHGTHTAASIAGDQLGNGVADRNDGMAPAARLFIQDAGTDTTGGLSVPSDLATLLEPAYRAGVRIHSNSWGGSQKAYGVKERSLDGFVASHPDMLVVVAAGNDGSLGSVTAPATAKNVLVVGALDSRRPQSVADFSSRGPTADGRIRPTLVAPGVGIISARAGASCDTESLSGTSMAAPIAAGAAALARQYFTDGFYPDGAANPAHALAPSAALLKAVLIAGADEMTGEGGGQSVPSQGQGFGRLHLDNALTFAGGKSRLWVLDDGRGLAQGESFSTEVTVEQGALRLAIAWMDQPAMAGALVTLVNDLDLELVDQDGQVRWGNLHGALGAPEASADHLNNEEVLVVPNLPAGTYTLRVRAWNVPMGPQPFALALVAAMGHDAVAPGVHIDAAGHLMGRTAGQPAAGAGGCQALSASDGAGAWLALAVAYGRRRRRRTQAAM